MQTPAPMFTQISIDSKPICVIMYMRYPKISNTPAYRPISHCLETIINSKAITVANKSTIEEYKFSVCTDMSCPVMSNVITQGKPKPMAISKIFEPTAFDIAYHPFLFSLH